MSVLKEKSSKLWFIVDREHFESGNELLLKREEKPEKSDFSDMRVFLYIH